MNKTMVEVPTTTSELRNVLILVVTDPGADWQTIALAAELIGLDVRFDNWFVDEAKRSLGSAALEEILAMSDEVTADVERAWRTRPPLGREELRAALQSALFRLANAMKQVEPGDN